MSIGQGQSTELATKPFGGKCEHENIANTDDVTLKRWGRIMWTAQSIRGSSWLLYPIKGTFG